MLISYIRNVQYLFLKSYKEFSNIPQRKRIDPISYYTCCINMSYTRFRIKIWSKISSGPSYIDMSICNGRMCLEFSIYETHWDLNMSSTYTKFMHILNKENLFFYQFYILSSWSMINIKSRRYSKPVRYRNFILFSCFLTMGHLTASWLWCTGGEMNTNHCMQWTQSGHTTEKRWDPLLPLLKS